MGRHSGDRKKDVPFKPEKPEPDTREGGNGKHSGGDGENDDKNSGEK